MIKGELSRKNRAQSIELCYVFENNDDLLSWKWCK